MINHIISYFLLKKAIFLNKDSIHLFKKNVRNIYSVKKKLIIALIGSPGSGKSYLINSLSDNGFLFKNFKYIIIDDLRDIEGKKYDKKELKYLFQNFHNVIFIVSDYRACKYLKEVDIIISIIIDESERIANLKKRNSKLFNLYKKKIFSISPIPMRFIATPIYKISSEYFYLLSG